MTTPTDHTEQVSSTGAFDGTRVDQTAVGTPAATPGAAAPVGAPPAERAEPTMGVPAAGAAALPGRRPWLHIARISAVALVALVVAAWGGIAPFVGPIFGFSADGTSSWTWNLPHALLAVVPGAVAVAAALWVMIRLPALAGGRARISLRVVGLAAVLSGAWFVIGPSAWPVLQGGHYFVVSDAWGTLMRSIGFAFGPGLVIAVFGGYLLGWIGRAGPAVERERIIARELEGARHAPPTRAAGVEDPTVDGPGVARSGVAGPTEPRA